MLRGGVAQVTRKKLFNTIQDMKGKIRVYCRVRPMLDFEHERSQREALLVPDELTVTHFWKDEKKAREYQFDAVRAPSRLPPASP
jgi:Microtubule binding